MEQIHWTTILVWLCMISACLSGWSPKSVPEAFTHSRSSATAADTLYEDGLRWNRPEQGRNRKGCLSKAGTWNTILAGDYSFQAWHLSLWSRFRQDPMAHMSELLEVLWQEGGLQWAWGEVNAENVEIWPQTSGFVFLPGFQCSGRCASLDGSGGATFFRFEP